MFDFSIGKVAILFALCLIVLGPEKLPKLAAQIGRFAGQARAMARHFRAQLEQEIAADELKKEIQAADEAIAKLAAETPPRRTGAGARAQVGSKAEAESAPESESEAEAEADRAESAIAQSASRAAESPAESQASGSDKSPSSSSV